MGVSLSKAGYILDCHASGYACIYNMFELGKKNLSTESSNEVRVVPLLVSYLHRCAARLGLDLPPYALAVVDRRANNRRPDRH
ncbi:hypothetical protein AB1N83_001925 [Pleurotus pulmonarius]